MSFDFSTTGNPSKELILACSISFLKRFDPVFFKKEAV